MTKIHEGAALLGKQSALPASPDEAELEAFDADHDGHIGILDAERARLGVLDAELEQASHEGGIKGKLADLAHKIVDKLDNHFFGLVGSPRPFESNECFFGPSCCAA